MASMVIVALSNVDPGGPCLTPQDSRNRRPVPESFVEAIADATGLIAKAASLKRPGPYQLQAAIVAVHAESPTWADTDWQQILVLYTMLDGLAPSPVSKLHRAIALRYTAGPAAALSEVDTLAEALEGYHLWHATRAELLRTSATTTRHEQRTHERSS